MVTRPELIFADEPTGNLDSNASVEVLGFLRRAVAEHGQSIVMVTHDPLAAAHSDRVVFLADGRVVGELRSPSSDAVLAQMKQLGA
jgi:putative ABC transport system ATP-binding protein